MSILDKWVRPFTPNFESQNAATFATIATFEEEKHSSVAKVAEVATIENEKIDYKVFFESIKLELQELFEERAAIMEYEWGIPRDEAEIFASQEARMYLEKKYPIIQQFSACLTIIQQN